jgi:signal transduction histidine kinase/sensor domain CHASE-containing protein
MRQKQLLWEEGRALLAVAFFCLFIGFLLDRFDSHRIESIAREAASRTANDILQELNGRINTYSIVLGRLVTVAEAYPDMISETFQAVGSRVFNDINATASGFGENTSAIMSIAMAPNLVVRHVYPLEKNRGILGFNYRDYPEQMPDIEAALATQTPILSHPFLSVQGYRTVAVRQRYESRTGDVEGVVSVAINLDILFDQLASSARQNSDHRVTFTIDGFGGFGETDVFRLEPFVLELKTHDIDWSIAVVPQAGWPELPWITKNRVLMTLVALMLMFSVHTRFKRKLLQHRQESRMEKAIDALSAGFVIYDDQGRLVHWNDTYRDMFNYGSILRKGMALEDILRAGLKHGIYSVPEGMEEAWIEENLEFHRSAKDSIEVKLANGRWIKSLSRRTEYGDLVGVRFDVTDLKNAQLAAERMSHAKSEMISVLSHELRTPLTTIIGFGRLLERDPPMTGDSQRDAFVGDALGRMLDAGQHLRRLIDEMLDYVELGANATSLKMERLNLFGVIEHKVGELEPIARQKGVVLQVDPNDVIVEADPARVEQIIGNLLSNAVKFTDAGGNVHISAKKGKRFALVTISDSGKGIQQDKLKHIFDEFFQTSPSGQRREGGIGMGLAITKRLVEIQGGQINVESIEGKGSTFSFSLPLAQIAA